MARVWVKPFTRSDGVKVKGYWRETSAPPAQRSTKVNVMKNDNARASSALSRQNRTPGDKLMKTRRAQKGKVKRKEVEEMAEALYQTALNKYRSNR